MVSGAELPGFDAGCVRWRIAGFFVHFTMAYYIRILGVRDEGIPLEELSAALSAAKLAGIACGKPSAAAEELTVRQKEGATAGGQGAAAGGQGAGISAGSAAHWTVMDVTNAGGEPVTEIERNPVVAGEFGQQELDEFRKLIQGEEPSSAVQWLSDYFNQVTVIYAFRITETTLKDDNYEIVIALKAAIWDKVGGLMQTDGEGCTNDQGYHILWQFPDTASGDRYCAVLDEKGEWQRFRMDLGDHFQRMAFRAGEVPQMAVRL